MALEGVRPQHQKDRQMQLRKAESGWLLRTERADTAGTVSIVPSGGLKDFFPDCLSEIR